jgi:hypothetical protein|tara:strand:+ start:701 stop:979 length:279 start_codon:yes stop_codon:yes gene_type:complete
MTAHVDEGSHLALSIADEENRDPADLERSVGMVLAEFAGEGEGKGQALENEFDFELPAVGIGVVVCRYPENPRRLIDGPRLGVGQMSLGQFY